MTMITSCFSFYTNLEKILWHVSKTSLTATYENNKVVVGALAGIFSPVLLFIFIPGVQVLLGHKDRMIWQGLLVTISILPWPLIGYVFFKQRQFFLQLYPTESQLFFCLILHYLKRYPVFYLLWTLPLMVTWYETHTYLWDYLTLFVLNLMLMLSLAMIVTLKLLSIDKIKWLQRYRGKYSFGNYYNPILAKVRTSLVVRVITYITALSLIETSDSPMIYAGMVSVIIFWSISINSDVKLFVDFPFYTHLTGHSRHRLRWTRILPMDIFLFTVLTIAYCVAINGFTTSVLFSSMYLTGTYIVAFAFAQFWRALTMPVLSLIAGFYVAMQFS